MNFENILEIIKTINSSVWGLPLVILLVGTGVFLTLRLFFIQIRYFSLGFRIAFGFEERAKKKERQLEEEKKLLLKADKLKDGLLFTEVEAEEEKETKEKEGEVSYFKALATALSATVGTGNIVGVAGALLVGGPGALFWMWMTAFVGMATKFSEAILAVKFRENTEMGYAGGPMYYITKGLKAKRIGKVLGILFAVFTMIAALGIGNIVQINSAAGVLENSSLAIPREVTAIVVAFLSGLVILGGIKRIANFAGFIVPFMAGFYIIGAFVVIGYNYEAIPRAFQLIFMYAFQPLPAASGTIAGILIISIRQGVKRGLFSNEAGLGSAPIVDASVKTDYAVKQGLVSMLGPFIDTLIICTITGLTIIIGLETFGKEIILNAAQSKSAVISSAQVSNFIHLLKVTPDMGIWSAMIMSFGAKVSIFQDVLTSLVFSQTLGTSGQLIVAIGLFFFSFSTIIGWYYYSDRALLFLGGNKDFLLSYKLLYILLIVVGGIISRNDLVWNVAEVFNALMAFPNLIALIFLSPIVAKETKEFFREFPHKHDFGTKIAVIMLKIMPKHLLSKLLGYLTRVRLPRVFMIPVLLGFAKFYKISLEESELELKDYKSLNKFFTRSLKNGSRIIDPDNEVIVSPVDGTLLRFGDLTSGKMIQSKGKEFSLEDFLGSNTFYKKFIGGVYTTLYLSPQDYHRIHAVADGKIIGYYYQPGTLFPVNSLAVENINKLFSKNERLITYIQTEKGLMAMVKIGATSVGKIKVTYDKSLSTNNWFRLKKEHFYKEPIEIAKGEEIGRFEFGSTVIMLYEKDLVELLDIEEKQRFRYGQPIAIFKKKDDVDKLNILKKKIRKK